MKVVVGLGNIGKQFENTRHNVGFLVVDYFLKKLKVKLDQENFDCFYTLAKINNDNFLFAKPTTLMNLSGNCVQKILNYYHVASENLIVFSDDLDQDLGKYKTRTSCSCGGHNGLRDITTKIKTYRVCGIKTDIVSYDRYPWIDNPVLEDGIRLASPKDIAAMKVNAIQGRGTHKDFREKCKREH